MTAEAVRVLAQSWFPQRRLVEGQRTKMNFTRLRLEVQKSTGYH